jgi:competence protein ComEC
MQPPDDTLRRSLARAPLALAAAAFTAGVVVSRFLGPPAWLCALLGAAFLVLFMAAGFGRLQGYRLLYLMLAVGCAGAALHARTSLVADDDIAFSAGPRPVPVVLRGYLDGEPRRMPAPAQTDPLLSQEETATANVVVRVRAVVGPHGEEPRSGRVRVFVSAKPGQKADELLAGLHACDEVEVSGRLQGLRSPGNPGEFDRVAYGNAAGVRATVGARPGAIRLIQTWWHLTASGWLGVARGWAHEALDRAIPGGTGPLARALVLGEGAPMQRSEWGKYVRTGVIHVLAISGQHLVIVGWFLWIALRCFGLRQTRAALLVAAILLGYALLTGGRPPAMRAAVVSCAVGLAIALHRPASAVSLFALSWIVVGVLHPPDYFDAGCQLSFWATAVLAWVGLPLLEREEDPLDKVITESRPFLWRCLYWAADEVWQAYKLCLIMWLAVSPLVAWHTGLVAPAALLIGPPLALLVSLALFAGLGVLALSWWPAAAGLLGWCVHLPLVGCEWLVNLAEAWPIHLRMPPVPGWWVLVLLAAVALLTVYPPGRAAWPWLAATAWLGVLFAWWLLPAPGPPGMRVTFADVGHGGCALIELPDGRMVLYDAGSMRGGASASAAVVPLLHERGVRRLDAIILSHADLDHFNGVAGLLDHFAVGRVVCSKTFEEKRTSAVAYTLAALGRRGVPIVHVAAGDRIQAGEAALDVLHPPAGWAGGTENSRSVVVQVRYKGRSVLLTGDLEAEGLTRVLHQPARAVDVLQVPHHGSLRVDLPGLAHWCRPGLAVSCQGAPRSPRSWKLDCPLWMTWEHGAVTVEWGEGLSASGHRSGQRLDEVETQGYPR